MNTTTSVQNQVPAESFQDILKRRYLSRLLSHRWAKERARSASENGHIVAETEYAKDAAGHNSACAEIVKIARDSGISLDTQALRQSALDFEHAAAEAARRFKEGE